MATPPKEDWWTPQQTALVEDRSRQWQLRTFEPSDALGFDVEGQPVVRKREVDEDMTTSAHLLPDGWEHEHCALCWQKISLLPDTDQTGYTDGRDWLCTPCHDKFIKPRTTDGAQS
jgi:hypothetical protein